MSRTNSNRDKDWDPLGNIKEDVQDIDFKSKGNWFNIKITGVTDSGQVKILGFEFPPMSIDVKENIKD